MVIFLIIIIFNRRSGFRSNKFHFKAQNLLQTHIEVTCVMIFAMLQKHAAKRCLHSIGTACSIITWSTVLYEYYMINMYPSKNCTNENHIIMLRISGSQALLQATCFAKQNQYRVVHYFQAMSNNSKNGGLSKVNTWASVEYYTSLRWMIPLMVVHLEKIDFRRFV